LKRDKTPRDIVAQTLDYGSWVQSLTVDKVEAICASHQQEAFARGIRPAFSRGVT
jgi:hypothetical protein